MSNEGDKMKYDVYDSKNDIDVKENEEVATEYR